MNGRLRIAFIAAVALGALTSATLAQSPCGTTTTAAEGETLAEIAERCDVTVAELREANPAVEGDQPAAGATIALPTAVAAESGGTDLLGRARELLRDAGAEIERAAREAGQSVSDYLSGNPDIGQDLRDLGRSYGLPTFDGSGAGVEVVVTQPLPAAGEEVTVTVTGLRPNAAAEIGIGPSRTDFEVVADATADANGRLETIVTLPDWVSASERVVFIVDTQNVTVRSDPIEVAGE